MMRTSALLLTSIALAACGSTTARPEAPAAPLGDDAGLLVIPVPEEPGERTALLAALERLAQRAQARDGAAAWARVHYLVDLFDDARFRRDDSSLAVLHQALGTSKQAPVQDAETARGPEATDAVLRALTVEVDRMLAADRLDARAQAASTLIAFDAGPPTTRAQAFQRTSELKVIARSSGPLAANARLRLFGYCRQALADALQARWAERTQRVAHCLYPLYDADPEPYFAADPASRPPPPRWQDLITELDRLAAPVAVGKSRLGLAGQYVRQDLGALVTAAEKELPVLPDPAALGLARVDRAALYDFTPLVILEPGRSEAENLAALDNVEALTRAVQGHGQATVALALAAQASAQSVLAAATAVRKAGATRLELLAWTEQTLVAPPGDYWAGRLPQSGKAGKVARLAAIELALATLDAVPGAGPGAAAPEPRTAHWDPRRASLGLHLLVDRDTWVLTSPTGVLATIPASNASEPVAALRAALERVSRAFASDDSLVLVPGPQATAGALVTAAAAASRDAQGRPLVAQLGLARTAPAVRASTLAQRIERRAGATVTIAPEALAGRAAVVRRCYQDVLEKQPRLAGTVRLELREQRVIVTDGPRDPAVRRCVSDALAPAMIERNTASATVTLQPS